MVETRNVNLAKFTVLKIYNIRLWTPVML